MTSVKRRGCVLVLCVLTIAVFAAPARADEIWVAPTAQQDFGGLGIASNTVWPATAVGAVRLAWSVPDNLKYFKYAKLVLIPHGAGSEGLVHVVVCPAEKNEPVVGPGCIAPPGVAYASAPNRLVEVDISGWIGPSVGKAGTSYVAVLAYTTPNTTTDHIVGLRFEYEPELPASVAMTGANTFTGTQTAPAFVGDGSGLTNLPFPAGAATLGANTFTDTQRISGGNLDFGNTSATAGMLTKNGQPFLHQFGLENVFLGQESGNFTMTTNARQNTAIGAATLYSNTTGWGNTASGIAALLANTSGYLNTATGYSALAANTTGFENTAVGLGALNSNTTGNRNIAVGTSAGWNATTGSNNVYVGAEVIGQPEESNAMYLGKGQTKTVIAGIRGITTGAANAIPVVIDSNGQLGTVSSSIRFKEDIHEMGDVSRRLLQLRPVTFRYTQAYRDGAKPIQYGLIAEEVADVFPELAVRGTDDQVETVHYETLNVLLLNEFQKQAQRIDEMERLLRELIATRRE